MASHPAYEPLPTSSAESALLLPEQEGYGLKEIDVTQLRDTRRTSRRMVLAVIVCVLCTIINLVLLARGQLSPTLPQSSPGRPKAPLARPNQYIGLETVNRTRFPFAAKPIVNFAPLLTQVSDAEPDLVYSIDSHRWLSPFGTVSPDDRHFYVDDKVHTVAQFRTHDYGMEACQINVTLSAVAVSDESRFSVSMSSEKTSVDVWRLEADGLLDADTLSWRTLPKRKDRVGRLDIAVGTSTATQHFRCGMDSLQTFVFSCAEPGCLVDFWQDKRRPLRAMFMHQHPTL